MPVWVAEAGYSRRLALTGREQSAGEHPDPDKTCQQYSQDPYL